MREYNIRTNPVEFLSIQELSLEEEINHHGKMMISGYIADEQEDIYLGLLSGNIWEQVQIISQDGEIRTLFTGVVANYAINYINDQKKLTLEIITGSCLLDGKKHLRSFQNPDETYEHILKYIVASYKDSDITFSKPYQEKTGELVLQYYETDWDFLKRMASRRHQFLIADAGAKGVKLLYAMSVGEEFSLPEGGKYRIKKNLDEYREKVYLGMEVSEDDCAEYMVECREARRLGDYTMIYGMKFYIFKMSVGYEKGELIYRCYMKREKGIEVAEIYQKDMAGCSLTAKVLKVKEDKVQVTILQDENPQQDIGIWYPYATIYSTPDGTGWYCMPEPGDTVRLTIPQKYEKDAFVASSVHVDTDSSDRKDPAHKVFKSKYQKEVRFTPDSIIITNNKGTKIELTDEEGIQITSAHSVILEAQEDLTITSSTGSLLMAGDSIVNLQQKGTGIQLEDNISFWGGELKIQ